MHRDIADELEIMMYDLDEFLLEMEEILVQYPEVANPLWINNIRDALYGKNSVLKTIKILRSKK